MKSAPAQNRRQSKMASERERMERGRRRLEELLRDAGPEILIIPHDQDIDELHRSTPENRPAPEKGDAQREAKTQPRHPAPKKDQNPPGSEELAEPSKAEKTPPKEAAHGPATAKDIARPLQPDHVPLKVDKVEKSHQNKAASPTQRRPQPSGKIKLDPAPESANKHHLEPQSQPDATSRPEIESTSEIKRALRFNRKAFVSLGVFSCIINILMLAGPLFMLQVYDRVITSGSVPTLVALTALTVGVYAIIGTLEIVRSRVIIRIGHNLDEQLGERIFDASVKSSVTGGDTGKSNQSLRELESLRQFVGSPGPLAFFDAPWTPIYLAVIFLTHWALGIAATIGAAILIVLTWLSESRSRPPLQEAGKAALRSLDIAETGQRNAETIAAMGMGPNYRRLWTESNRQSLSWQMLASDRLGTMNAFSRTLRLLMQSLMLAVGALLAIYGEITAGAIIAGTIIFGRALAPIEQAIGHWRPFLKARECYERLGQLLDNVPPQPRRTALPKPKGNIEVNGLRVASPATRQLIIGGVSFKVAPAQMLAVVGPSASGKSTLVRALTGLWPAAGGQITLDGARLDQWNPDDLGPHIGYLPQSVELFAGTVRQNISRFCPNASDEEVLDAAKAAFAHELILSLPDGYDTELGSFGTYLSGGQRQRIALARALFRRPALVVLDEPNANLDRNGDVALSAAIDDMRAHGQTVILVSHRIQAIGKADLLLLMEKGQQRAFGPREAVLKMLRGENEDAKAATADKNTDGGPQQ
ncbi:MAG: type I secretion system permease/ATPase [Filomicrobium sp.]